MSGAVMEKETPLEKLVNVTYEFHGIVSLLEALAKGSENGKKSDLDDDAFLVLSRSLSRSIDTIYDIQEDLRSKE